jgi:hypothetical protein
MKAILVTLSVLTMGSSVAQAQFAGQGTGYGTDLYGTGSNPKSHYVQPHTTYTGTYIPGHHRTNPNTTQRDNYGAFGNVNPYTGTIGRKYPQY